MTNELIKAIESGLFWSRFNHCIYSIEDDNILCKWLGKYICEIQKFSILKYSTDKKYHLTLEMYSDYGLGPRVYIAEEEIEDFLQGKPCSDGSYLCGRGIKTFLKDLLIPLIEFTFTPPKFESELQKKEYEQALCDVHLCKDRRTLIHSKKGAQIVLLYMKVWQVGPVQAMRELITDGLYASFVCPLREAPLEVQTNKVSEHPFTRFLGMSSPQTLSSDVLDAITVE